MERNVVTSKQQARRRLKWTEEMNTEVLYKTFILVKRNLHCFNKLRSKCSLDTAYVWCISKKWIFCLVSPQIEVFWMRFFTFWISRRCHLEMWRIMVAVPVPLSLSNIVLDKRGLAVHGGSLKIWWSACIREWKEEGIYAFNEGALAWDTIRRYGVIKPKSTRLVSTVGEEDGWCCGKYIKSSGSKEKGKKWRKSNRVWW